MMNNSKLNYFTLTILLALVSCGQDHSKVSSGLASLGEEFGTEIKPLNADSEVIALRICNAFRSKRSYWHTTPIIGMKANLSVNTKSCFNETDEYDLDTKIFGSSTDKGISFDSLTYKGYYRHVLTEIHGPLSTICPSIFSGNTPLEFYNDEGGRVYTEFYKTDSSNDRLILKYSEIDSDDQQEVSGYKVFKTYIYDIVTTSSDPTYLGTVTSTSSAEVCQDDTKSSTLTQKLNSIL